MQSLPPLEKGKCRRVWLSSEMEESREVVHHRKAQADADSAHTVRGTIPARNFPGSSESGNWSPEAGIREP